MLSNYKVIKLNNLKELLPATRKLDNFSFLAGGTDLIVQLKEKNIKPDVIIDLSGLSELKNIKEDKNSIFIGALAKIAEIENSSLIKEHAPSLAYSCEVLGSTQIRNMGTIGGNIANASPVGDTLPPLYTCQAKLILTDGKNEREASIEKFIVGYKKTILKKGEILKTIIIPKRKNYFSYFKKIGQRKALTISKVSLALCGYKESKKIKSIKIALGAVGPKIIQAKGVEALLLEKELNENLIEKACLLIAKEISPITDLRSTVEYRIRISQELLREALFKFAKFKKIS